MENISKLIEIFDNYLLQNNKSFIGLRTGNELIKNSIDEEVRKIDLKKILELGLIPNSYLTNTTKRQWRIHLSKSAEEKLYKEMDEYYEDESFISSRKSFNSNKDLEKKQKENGKKILFATIGILAFFYFVFINLNKEKSKTNTRDNFSQNISEYETINNINPSTEKFFFFRTNENIKVKKSTGEVIQTNYETCYLTFDFNNNIIKIKAPLSGEWTTSEYQVVNSSSRNYDGDEVYFLNINSNGMKQAWISPKKNLIGYDYDDGSRIICYKLERIE